VWSPHTAYDISTLQNVQHHAARWACGNQWDSTIKRWNKSSNYCVDKSTYQHEISIKIEWIKMNMINKVIIIPWNVLALVLALAQITNKVLRMVKRFFENLNSYMVSKLFTLWSGQCLNIVTLLGVLTLSCTKEKWKKFNEEPLNWYLPYRTSHTMNDYQLYHYHH